MSYSFLESIIEQAALWTLNPADCQGCYGKLQGPSGMIIIHAASVQWNGPVFRFICSYCYACYFLNGCVIESSGMVGCTVQLAI